MAKESKKKEESAVATEDFTNDLIKAINRDEFFSAKNICGIEQTTSGYVNLKENSIKFPVINLARSSAKLKLESPYIADAVISKLKENLGKIGL